MQATWLYVSAVTAFLLGPVGGARARGRQRPAAQQLLSNIPSVHNLDLQRFSGRWLLNSVASKCCYLQENNFQLESTSMILTAPTSPTSPLIASTLRKLNQQCWNITQEYIPTQSSSRFLIADRRDNIEVVVSETDYISYALLYYRKHDQVTLKLYGRSTQLPDSTLDRFEDLAEKQGIAIDHVYPFPKYGFCEVAEKSL
ncbi:complement component C8 gamma chain [Brienomyrus brachyistius]|uniref:complement component C8 gamma chain n=1 Tax=Brienomyrus brachyistius TaxID=42636 RepID=UPI0020B3339D|nr:complement component C8 gamma chain [Brienomyrus brachyistius]